MLWIAIFLTTFLDDPLSSKLTVDKMLSRFQQNIYVVIEDPQASQSLNDRVACFQNGVRHKKKLYSFKCSVL